MSSDDARKTAEIEAAYVERRAQLDEARAALIGSRGQGRDALDAAGAAYRKAEHAAFVAHGDVEAVFGPYYGRSNPADGDSESWGLAGDGASAHNWRAEDAAEEGRAR